MMHLVLSIFARHRASRYPLLLLALHDLPALELGDRPVLFDPYDVADRVFIGLVVGVVLLRPPHRLLEHRMGEAALDADDHGLVLLVAHHGALEHPLRHSDASYFDFACARFCRAIVFSRAMSRRTWRTRAVFSSCPVARWKRRLNCSFFSLSTSSSSFSTSMPLASAAFMTFDLLADALDEARLDRQLGGGEIERLTRDLDRHAVDLEQHAPRLDAAHPQFRRALALAHAHFDRLLRYRHVREDADPHAPGALHVARHRAPRRLDLAGADALRLQRLEPELPERERVARGGDAADAALVGLAKFGAVGLQHRSDSFVSNRHPIRRRGAAARHRPRPSACPAPSGRAP